jgi:alpha-tubulin suppressor-like RCC1 family protein
LGDGTFISKNVPVLISSLDNVEEVSGTFYHTIVVTSTSVYSFGLNDYGQLGCGNTTNLNSPYAIIGVKRPYTAATGMSHTLIATKDSTLYGFGNDTVMIMYLTILVWTVGFQCNTIIVFNTETCR